MKSNQTLTLAILLALALPLSAKADFVMNVVASSAPNFFGSPNWTDYATNAIFSLENDAGDIGDRTVTPSAYEQFSTGQAISVNELIVSSFASWRGMANPAAPFDQENGNRLHFGLHLMGDGSQQFAMADIEYEITSDDGNSLGFAGDLSGGNYSSVRVGIDWGADRVKGGGDDTVITSGVGTQLIDEFIYVGVGNAFDASSQPGPTDQDKLDQTRQDVFPNYPIIVTGTYRLQDGIGGFLVTGSTFVQVVPEPTSIGWCLAVGTALLAGRRRRR